MGKSIVNTTRILALTLILFFCGKVNACDCGTGLPDWSASEVQEYDIVFVGRVDSIVPYAKYCLAYFTGISLYNGVCIPYPVVRFDCQTSCSIPFYIGDEWLVYSIMGADGYPEVDYCGRTRPNPGLGSDDYASYSRIGYDRELQLLRSTFPKREWTDSITMQRVFRGEVATIDGRRELLHPTRRQIVLLLLVSATVMAGIWLLMKRLWKD